MDVVALVVAAGRGRRLGEIKPKQYLPLGGKTVLRRGLERFLDHPAIDRVQVVIDPEADRHYMASVTGLDLPVPIAGGDTRQESVYNGLKSLTIRPPDLVLIHDAARPFVRPETIDGVIAELKTAVGAIPALPIVDSLKRGHDDHITRDLDRAGLYRAQTPQGFRFPEILAAHAEAPHGKFTDDAAILRAAGHRVHLVAGQDDNLKITTAADYARAQGLLRLQMETRTGQGFDVHRFGDGHGVTLCGVEIAHDRGLVGHSDADVALHALTDAVLGALGAGDIGQHFPPGDDKWRDAASDIFLRHAAGLVAEAGGEIVHLDLTVICEAPKIGPHRDAMRARVAAISGIDVGRVAVKATTTEGLGFTGRGEGIAAQALATLRLPPP